MGKKKVAKFLKKLAEYQKESGYYLPKKIGESRSVEYEVDGLTNTIIKVTEWENMEGYDITLKSNEYVDNSISLDKRDIESLLMALNDLKYFDEV